MHNVAPTQPKKSTNSMNSKIPSVSYKNTVTIQTRVKITLLHPPPQAAPAAQHRRPACRSPAPRRRPWHRPSSQSTPPAAKAPGKEVEAKGEDMWMCYEIVNSEHTLAIPYYLVLSLTIPYYPLLSLAIPYYPLLYKLAWLRFGNILDNDKPKLRLFGSFWGWQASTSEIGHLRTVHRELFAFTCLFLQKLCNLTCSKSVLLQVFNIGEGVSSNLVCDPIGIKWINGK